MSVLGEAAAIGGLTSLGFSLLTNCIEAFLLISDAQNLGADSSYLVCALRLEENRLVLWALHSGLSRGKLDERLNQAVIYETLANIRALLCDTNVLKTNYGLDLHDQPPLTSTSSTPSQLSGYVAGSNPNMPFLDQELITNERNMILQKARNVQRSVSAPRKFWWAAVDKKGFAKLINQIGHLIQRLLDLLWGTQQAELVDDIRLIRLQGVTVQDTLDRLESMIAAFTVGGDLNDAAASTAKLRRLRLVEDVVEHDGDSELYNRLLHAPSPSPHGTSLKPAFSTLLTDIRKFDDTETRAIARYDSSPVYLEWKEYNPRTAVGPMRQKIFNRITSLASLLNAANHSMFSTLTCQALFEEERSQRFCFLYEWPLNSHKDIQPKSLLQYLCSNAMPSLTDRLRLARELARSLFLFHAAGWLHKGFRSDNVLFFPSTPWSLDRPFIVGFEYSRLDVPGESSEATVRTLKQDIYRHPNCQGEAKQPFHKLYDFYALGLVLVEIARWRPLEYIFFQTALDRKAQEHKVNLQTMSKKDRDTWKSSIIREYQVYIEHMASTLVDSEAKGAYPTDIAFKMGTIYKDVVLTCLRGDIDIEIHQDTTGKRLQAAFFHKVVKKLESCVI